MTKICASCGEPKEAFTFAAEGPLCHTCVLKASTVVATYWINGERFHVCLKATKNATPATAIAGARKGA